MEMSEEKLDEMQLKIGSDTIWKCPKLISMTCIRFSADTLWKCLRTFSMRCNWIMASTQFGIVIE